MRTLICDLDTASRRQLGLDRRFDVVLGREDLERSLPCARCLDCWATTPGRCVLNDPLAELGPVLGVTSELSIVSRSSFGCYGSLVGRALDRCAPVVLPLTHVVDGETRPRRRRGGALSLSVWLYGHATPEERSVSLEVARATARGLGAELRGVWFPKSAERLDLPAVGGCPGAPGLPPLDGDKLPGRPPRRVALLAAEPESGDGASRALLDDLAEATVAFARYGGVTPPELTHEPLSPSGVLRDASRPLDADALVVAFPLHVGGPPSGLVAALEDLASSCEPGTRTSVYALACTDAPEPRQLMPSLAVVRCFCAETGLTWRGGVALGGARLSLPTRGAPRMGTLRRHASEAIDQLAIALLAGAGLDVVMGRCPVPRAAYRLATELWWRRAARAAGVDLTETPRPDARADA